MNLAYTGGLAPWTPRVVNARPNLPTDRWIIHGDPNFERCPLCLSAIKKRFWCFGKILGCINPACDNYYKNQ